MQSVVLEFENRQALEQAVAHLWDALGVTGALSSTPLPEGRFRLEILAEKPLRGSQLEGLGGRRVVEE